MSLPEKKPPTFKYPRWLLALTSTTLAVSLTLLLAEGAVRWLVPRHYWATPYDFYEIQEDSLLGWVTKPFAASHYLDDLGQQIDIRTNQDGLQPGTCTRARGAGRYRILLFGNSTVIGREVPQAARLHGQLQLAMARRGRQAEVINAGVSGFATDQSLLFMQRLLPHYQPDVVLYGFCENDLAANTWPRDHGLHKPRFARQADSLRLELPAPNPVIRGRSSYRPANLVRRWVYLSALGRLLWPRLRAIQFRYWPPSPDPALTGSARASFYQDPAAWAKPDTALFAQLVGAMQRTCQQRGAQFAWYAHPAAEAVWNPQMELVRDPARPYDRFALENRLATVAQAQGTLFSSNVQYFVERQAQGPFHLLPLDPHCNPAGYGLQAEVLADFLVGRGLLGPGQVP
jgi:lysophospholipase L1-like esterase